MKKLSLILLLILITNTSFASYIDKQLRNSKRNQRYNSTKYYKQDVPVKTVTTKLKDPKLIKLSDCGEINTSDYNRKTKEDEKVYEIQHKALKPAKESNSLKQPLSSDLYNLYRITEKIIRANKLDYVNWRVVIYNDTKEFNAYTTSANLIAVYSGLYDSLYNNEDALAFVIAHELSHQLLEHIQRIVDLNTTYRRWVSSGQVGTLDMLYYKELRDIEIEADSQAIELLARAGYSPNKALDAISFMQTLPEYTDLYSSHPEAQKRKNNAVEIIQYISPDWEKEGRYNLYNSSVLEAKRSSDKISFAIAGNNKDNVFELETYDKRLLRYAYMAYLNSNNKIAVKYFEKLTKERQKFEYYLYLSYAYENLYKETNKTKFKEKAINAIQSAKNLAPANSHVLEQEKDLAKI